MHQIEEKFSRIFKYMGIPEEQVRPDASFVKDLKFEEFQFNCLVFYIGSYFKIEIRECDYKELKTIGSTMAFVRKKLEKPSLKSISHDSVF